MRCPRNNIHINLFAAFTLQAILALLIEILQNKTSIFQIQETPKDENYIPQLDNDQRYIKCRVLWTIYRYFHSVYTCAITIEAVYLALLLKFPYYSEKQGSKFCMAVSWLLPVSWIVIWVLVKIFLSGTWYDKLVKLF
jgi:hypothetical protein